ncbi:RNA polymerase subunit sigma-70 [Streptomyces sp. SID3343]|uniref:RNA polymerase subunit sigma-70 n=1 Tax=Streptomyces sp. SID3343 TaxID=2690260 RepID=UPI001371F9D0|nr:RNA polymerase subunit sigma-70 [Streptomyces sp. SID3343]MYV98872.1 RNA polymerase subunit sigma-70 [Streptomyces sp. SID3343]
MRKREAREFDVFVHTVGAQLLHAADLLTGDRRRAERRVERALVHTCLKWSRLPSEDPVRTAWHALLRGYLDPWRPGPRGYQGEPADAGEPFSTLDRLGRVERAAVVLRLYARLDEHDAAQALGLPIEAVALAWRRGMAEMLSVDRPRSAEVRESGARVASVVETAVATVVSGTGAPR